MLTAGVVAACLFGNAGAAPPQRIVSINICCVRLALSRSSRSHIVAVTFLAASGACSQLAR